MYIIRGRGQCYFYIYRYGTRLYIQIYVIQDTDIYRCTGYRTLLYIQIYGIQDIYRYTDIWDIGH